MGVKRGRINRPEAEEIARQITQSTNEDAWFGYDPGDGRVQGTPQA